MNGGNWSVLDLTGDPVRGEPGEVRALANASQQEARRWEEQVRALRTVADEGSAMQMEGDFAPRFRQMLQAHPKDATPLARGRADAGQALVAYASALEQAKRTSQTALSQGAQARQAHRAAKQAYEQAVAQMNAMPKVVPPQQYPYVLQQFNMLRARAQRAWQAMQQAEAQWKAARQRAVQAGEQAAQQERVAAERVMAAAPTRAAAAGAAKSGRANGGTPARSAAMASPGVAAGRPPAAPRNFGAKRDSQWGDPGRRRDVRTHGDTPFRTTAPSHKANDPRNVATGKPRPTDVVSKKRSEARGLNRDNQSENDTTQVVARQGFKVQQNPKVTADHPSVRAGRVSANRDPDFEIEGRLFDNKRIGTNTPVENIWSRVDESINGRQADGVVLDMTESRASLDDLAALFRKNAAGGVPMPGEVWVRRGDDLLPFWP